MVRAKFRVVSVSLFDSPKGAGSVKLAPVFANAPGVDGNACEENQIFGKYTPCGEIGMSIKSSAALQPFLDALQSGHPFYVDFTPAEN